MTDTYYQTERKGKVHTRNTVPFIKDVLRAKLRSGNGTYCYCDAEILSYGNMWELGGRYFQHIKISDGQTQIEIQAEIYEPTDAYDELGWHVFKMRWIGTPSLNNIHGIIQEKI